MASVDHLEQVIRQAEGSEYTDLQAQGELKSALTLVYDAAMAKKRSQTPAQEKIMVAFT